MKGEGPFTVFAPTDEACAALPDGTVESLLEPENVETLIAALTYHVILGAVTSGDIDGPRILGSHRSGHRLPYRRDRRRDG